jgi:hypothetical protein
MKTEINSDSVFINGIEYTPKKDNSPEINTSGLPYVMIRTYSAGVHFGYLAKRESTAAGIEVKLVEAQRMRYWEGAMDLTQLAQEGSKSPDKCKPSVAAREIELVAIEIIPISQEAAKQLKSMKIWKS